MLSDYFVEETNKDNKFAVQSAKNPIDYDVLEKITQYQILLNERIKYKIWIITIKFTGKRQQKYNNG